MLSLKHVEDDGRESILEAVSVSFDPQGKELIGYGCPTEKGGVVRCSTGLVYVMNEQGKTVGVYNLRKQQEQNNG